MSSVKNKNSKFSEKLKSGRNVIFFIASILGAFLLTRLLRDRSFSDSQDYVMFLLFFSIGLWVTEAIPPFAVGLIIMAYLVFALGNEKINENPQDVTKYIQTLSNNTIWLLLGGFFLAEAMTKTGIDADFFRFSIRLSGKIPKNLLLGIMMTTMLASMILSNSATTSMVLASVAPLLKKIGKDPFSKSLLVGVPLAASIGGMGTIIGSPTNAIAAGILENMGMPVSFIKWMYFGFPLALILTLTGWWLLKSKFITSDNPIEFEIPSQNDSVNHLIKTERRIVLAVLVVTVLLWLTSSIHHINVSAVSLVPIVFLTMTGVLKPEDIRKIPWDTLILVAGGLSLGLALEETRLLEHFANNLLGTHLTPFVLIIIFAYVTMIFSNIMSNTATATILIPLGIYLLPDHSKQIAIVVGLAASTALMLAVSTPPNAIAYSTGLIKQKDFFPGG
ncbi:MAG TPA: DASS family sodium-coupled anion symporter, partial [Puia sp.]|nr:DASS family sodium-coupled anion symporter [Puia sp.]